MAINISQAFHRTSANPVDETLTLTKAQMLTVNDNLMPSKYLTVCQDDGKIYLYDKSNESDVQTGKFRVFEGGSTITIDSVPTENSTNAVQSGGTYTALSGKVDKVSGKQLSTEDYTTADKTKLAGINLSNYVPTSQKGANNGVAELDSSGKVPSSQLPSYVDDVVSRTTKNDFPAEGEDDKIYIAKDENASYRWDGTEYVSISSANGLTLGETSSTAYRGDRGKIAYDDSQTNKTNIGTMSNLTTTEKSSLVGAINEVDGDLANKVDKVSGKGLSTNDYDNTEKQKVTNAQPQTLATAKTIEGTSVTTVQGLADATQTHTDRAVTDTNGVHGFKVTTSGGETKLYYKSGNSWTEIEIGSSTVVTSLPTASQDNYGTVLQYIGATTSVAPIYIHGYFYECVEDGGVYSWANIPVMDVQEVQKTSLPTASADELGNIYQFIGTTTSSYTNGYFYKCVAQGTDPETYAWEAQLVQEGGGGSSTDSRIKSEILEFGVTQSGAILTPYIKVSYELPPINQLTMEEVIDYANAYYNGDLSLADIQANWQVGQYTSLTLDAMPAYSTGVNDSGHPSQIIQPMLVAINHYDISEDEDNRKALLTFYIKDCLNEVGLMDNKGTSGYDEVRGWRLQPRRGWCNDIVYNAFSQNIKSEIKPVVRSVWANNSYSTEEDIVDYVFFPEAKEIGDNQGGGTAYGYFDTSAKRVKNVDGVASRYWLGNDGIVGGGYHCNQRIVDTDGTFTDTRRGFELGLAFGFCI